MGDVVILRRFEKRTLLRVTPYQFGNKQAMKFKSDYKVVRPIIIWTIMSFLISLLSVEILGITFSRSTSFLWTVLLTIILLFTIAGPFVTVVMAVKRSFKPQPRERQIVVIILSYFALIITFTGAYYAMVGFGDRVDAIRKFEHYQSEKNYLDTEGNIVVRKETRPFRGFNYRLWSGVDWPDVEKEITRDRALSPHEPVEMIRNARGRQEDVIRFQPASKVAVMGNLLYYTIVTMTTLGYGDITPTAWYTKMFASMQVLSGYTLFYIALAMVISNWWGDYTEPDAEPEDAS